MSKKKIIKYIILIILCMLIIFIFSSQKGSQSNNLSKSVANRIILLVETLTNKDYNNYEIIKIINYPIRKLAHFSIFFLLSWLLFSFFKELNIKSATKLTILICLIYSSFDEVHQLFTLDRTAKIFDVFIDMSGVIFAIFVKSVYNTKKQREDSYEK